VEISTSSPRVRDICNRIEALSNLVYLIKHDLRNADKINIYVAMAESELSRLSDIARQFLGETKP
jgi:hypothetical protein